MKPPITPLLSIAIGLMFGLLVLVGCQTPAETPTPIIQTVVYYNVMEVPMTQVVTRQIEVTRLVIVTREVEKIVTATPPSAVTPTLASSESVTNTSTITSTITALVIQPATLFSEASATSKQLLVVQDGTIVQVLGRSANNSWLHIQLEDGVRGFASVSRLKLSVDVDMLPLATPPHPNA